MKENRERLFFGNSQISAWNFTTINTLNLMFLLKDKKDLHGRYIQQLFSFLFNQIWTCGDDLTYKVLNELEENKYVQSKWLENEDTKKKHIRLYRITDDGINYLNSLKPSFFHNLQSMNKFLNTSLNEIWGDIKPQESSLNKELISSSLFTEINLLNLLYKESKSIKTWFYGKEMKDILSETYNHSWSPSYGVLYPRLSSLESNDYIKSRWADNQDTASSKKKRSVREYSITPAGIKYLNSLTSPDTGLKNKIINSRFLYEKSFELIFGNSTENTTLLTNIISSM